VPDEEGFRRYLQAGMAWFSVTQQKAEGILREVADSGESAIGQAQKAFERIVERSRQGSDELRQLVRTEIREQVSALGLATKDDIARLEAKLDADRAAAQAAGTGEAAAPPEPPPASNRRPEPVPSAAKSTAPPRRSAARTKGAPITKAATTRKTAGSGSGGAEAGGAGSAAGKVGRAPGSGARSGTASARGSRAPAPPDASSPEKA
jgi:polyhydroxyalkanoate synthesis regulator phasin